MKRRLLVSAALLAMLCAALAAFGRGGAKPLTVLPLEPALERDFLLADLTYDVGTRTLRGRQTLTATNRTGDARTEAVLRLYMNGQEDCSVSVAGVTADGESVPFALDEEDATVLRIPLDWQPGQTVELSFALMITHQKMDGAAIVTLPALAVYEDGAWRCDAYDNLADPSYAEAFDYAVTLDGALYQQMQGARDVSLALCPGGKAHRREVHGVLLTAVASSSREADTLLDRAQEALGDLGKIGLAYPFPSLTVAAGDTGRKDGLALSGLIALDTDGDRETLRRRITRLIARQTFGILVESDPWNAPWLSVSLASTAELLSYRQRRGQDAYSARFFDEVEVANRLTRPAGVTVGAGTAFFGGDAEMTQVLRDQGAAMLLGIEGAVGEAAFLRALQSYVQAHAGKIAGRDALEAALMQETGSDWSGYLSDELSW